MRSVQDDALSTLARLRASQVDALELKLARKEQLGQRYRNTIVALDGLCRREPPPGNHPALAMNLGQYKGALISVLENQKRDLALHEMDVAAERRVLLEAWRKQAGLEQLLAEQQRRVQRRRQSQEQKRTDDLAAMRVQAAKV